MDAIAKFSKHVVKTGYDDLSSEAISATKTFLLDTIGVAVAGCASSLSYLARFFMRGSPIGRFDEVASDLVARRDATKSLSLAFEGRECPLQRGARGCVVCGELQRSLRP